MSPTAAPPPEPADAVLAALTDLRPADVPGPPPAWARGLVGSADLELVVAAARAEPDLAVRWLAAMLTGEARDRLFDVTDGEAPTRAAWVLGGLGLVAPHHVEAAVDALVDALLTSDVFDPLYEEATNALAEIGAPALETVLAAHAAERGDTVDRGDSAGRVALEGVLATSRLDDPRIRALLVARLERDPERGANLCGAHGDPRYLPVVRALWDALPAKVAPDDEPAARAGLALGDAVIELGGTWTEADHAKLDAYEAAADDLVDDGELGADLRDILDRAEGFAPSAPTTPTALDEAMDLERVDDDPAEPLVRRATPGRNDPCWCGSGKKYKKCHADEDARGGGPGR